MDSERRKLALNLEALAHGVVQLSFVLNKGLGL